MKTNQKLGMGILVVGVALIASSFYIKSQVEAGKTKIVSAEAQVSMEDKLLSLAPKAQELGKEITGSVQKKINEGQSQVDFYATVAKCLEIGGVIAFVVGASLVFFRNKRV